MIGSWSFGDFFARGKIAKRTCGPNSSKEDVLDSSPVLTTKNED